MSLMLPDTEEFCGSDHIKTPRFYVALANLGNFMSISSSVRRKRISRQEGGGEQREQVGEGI
jgi:hypothetical protein